MRKNKRLLGAVKVVWLTKGALCRQFKNNTRIKIKKLLEEIQPDAAYLQPTHLSKSLVTLLQSLIPGHAFRRWATAFGVFSFTGVPLALKGHILFTSSCEFFHCTRTTCKTIALGASTRGHIHSPDILARRVPHCCQRQIYNRGTVSRVTLIKQLASFKQIQGSFLNARSAMQDVMTKTK